MAKQQSAHTAARRRCNRGRSIRIAALALCCLAFLPSPGAAFSLWWGAASKEPAAAAEGPDDFKGPGPGARLLAAQVKAASSTDACIQPAFSTPPPKHLLLIQPLPNQVVFRHGARTPLSTAFFGDLEWACNESYAGAPALDLVNSNGGPLPPLVDPDAPQLPGGCPQGTLTQRGFEMGRDLGRELRGRYVDDLALLPARFEAGSVFSQTTMFRRTIATLRVSHNRVRG
jgi:hypothetical protein